MWLPYPTDDVTKSRLELAMFSPRSCFVFFTLVTGPRRSLSLKLSDTRVYEPQIRSALCPHEADIGLFKNVEFEGRVQDASGNRKWLCSDYHVPDSQTTCDVNITTRCQLRPSLERESSLLTTYWSEST